MKRHILFTTILSLLFLFSAKGNVKSSNLTSDYYPYIFGTSDGLSNNSIFSITKWKDKFIWIATKQGIDMYNGNNFKHYPLFNDNVRSAKDGQLIFLFSGDKTNLWAYTDSGQIYFFDEEADSFHLFLSLPSIYDHTYLHAIYPTGKKLYLCLNNRMECVDITNKKTLFMSLAGYEVKCITRYYADKLLIGTNEGIFIFTESTQSIEPIKMTKHLYVQTLFYKPDIDCIFIGCEGQGLWTLDKKNKLHQINNGLKTATIRSIRQLDKNNLLIGSDGNGLFTMNPTQNNPSLIATDINSPGILQLQTSSIYDILIDDKNIWIANFRGGLTLLRKNSGLHLIKNKNSEVMSDNFAHGICEGNNKDIWIAFNSSIGNYNFATQDFKTYLNRKGGFLDVVLDQEGFLWCGGYNSGIYRLNTKTGSYSFYPSLAGHKENDCVQAMCKDLNGDIWIGGLNFNLTRIKVDGKHFTQKEYNIRLVQALLPISKDTLLVGTADGLRILNSKTGNIESYLNASDSTISWKGSSFINCMTYETDKKQIWLGTEGSGLLCYNCQEKSLVTFTTKNGIPSNYIAGMHTDNQNHLWVTTENAGMFIFDLKQKRIVSSIQNYNGLYFNEFFPNSSYLLSDGRMVFGGHLGVVILSPSPVIYQSSSRQIHFTDLKVGDENISKISHPQILNTALDKAQELSLPYENRSFRLSVCTDDLYNQSTCPIYYRLTGYDNEWKALCRQYEISYTNLAPGKYVLQIRGNSAKSETYITRNLNISVEQNLWLRWYFIVLYASITVGLIYWTFITYKTKLEERQTKEKLRFFINIAHDIRTPLTLIKSPLSKIKQLMHTDKDSGEEQEYLLNTTQTNVDNLLNTINQLIDFDKMNLSDGILQWQTIDMKTLVEKKKYAYQTFTKEKGLTLQTDIQPGEYYVYADSTMLNRVLDNLLSNAIKYTNQGSITIRLTRTGKDVSLEVKDTGIGISRSSAKNLFKYYYRGNNAINQQISGSGIGLFFAYNIVKKMGGKLSFKSVLNTGSTFILQFPSKQHGQESTETASPLAKNEMSRNTSNKENILLVEDNQEFRHYLSHVLSTSYNVTEAESADTALSLVSSKDFDLIISDIMMPGIKGDEFCKHIKNHIETSHIPVILLTANADKQMMTTGLTIGADDYITKPFDTDVLELKIHNLFENRKKLHAYYLSKMQLHPTSNSTQKKITEQNGIDDIFLVKVAQIITDNLSNTDFSVNDLCSKMAMSRTLFYEKIRKLLGIAPNDLIRNIRMKQAKLWLEEGKDSVTDIAFKCGYQDVRYFSTAFKKHFGISPSKIKLNGKE